MSAEQQRIPGTGGRTAEQLQRRAHITAAACELHRAIKPMLDLLDSKCSISMKFKVAGDDMTVSIKPGTPNDEENR